MVLQVIVIVRDEDREHESFVQLFHLAPGFRAMRRDAVENVGVVATSRLPPTDERLRRQIGDPAPSSSVETPDDCNGLRAPREFQARFRRVQPRGARQVQGGHLDALDRSGVAFRREFGDRKDPAIVEVRLRARPSEGADMADEFAQPLLADRRIGLVGPGQRQQLVEIVQAWHGRPALRLQLPGLVDEPQGALPGLIIDRQQEFQFVGRPSQ